MRRLLSLALTGLLLVVSSAPLEAQVTKSKVRARARQAGQTSKLKWDALSPAEQEQFRQLAKERGQDAQARWEALSPEQQQAFRQQARGGADRLRRWWQTLPE